MLAKSLPSSPPRVSTASRRALPSIDALRDYGVDGQIGLESTPDEWVAALVAVFAECRRVLRPAGSMFVECGDSYATNAPGNANSPNGTAATRGEALYRKGQGRFRVDGYKPKDLIGQPFLLAQALRGPWYMGRIKSDLDRVWLAAMVDAEGCIHIHRRKAGTDSGAKWTRKDGTTVSYERTKDTYGVMVSVSNTNADIIERCRAIYGLGSTRFDAAGEGVQKRKQTLHRWTVVGDQARELLRELYPHLIAKQHEARLALACPTANGGDYQEAIKALHNGDAPSLDGKPPAPMWEPGFYWRGTYIWGKSNAMPESAKDRCTTAHSYVLHFAKSARYFFDGDAIAEPAEWARWGDQTVPKHNGTATASGWVQPKTKQELLAVSTPKAALRDDAGLKHAGQFGRVPGWRKDETQLAYAQSKHPRSVWTIPTRGFPGAHFATWPEALAERIIKAGCPEGGTVLDPFAGSGTTGLVARRHGRRSILIELSPAYAAMAAERCNQLSLLAASSSGRARGGNNPA